MGTFAPRRRTMEIRGSRVRYFSYGATHRSAELIVMVHGLRGTHEGLELLASELLTGCDAARRVIIPDLPGYGESTAFTDARHDVAGYAQLLRELVERIRGTRRSVVLVGHSFGSVIAAHVASAWPHLVRRLVLVNAIATLPLGGPRAVLSALTSGYYALGRALPPKLGHAWLGNRYAVLVASRAMTRSKDPDLRRFIDESHLRYFSRFHSPAVLNETYQASISNTVTDYAQTLHVPTLLIAGAADDIAPLRGQRRAVSRLRNAELVVLDGVGHLVHYEAAARAAAAIADFLTAERPQRAS